MSHGLHPQILKLRLWLGIRGKTFSICAWEDSRKCSASEIDPNSIRLKERERESFQGQWKEDNCITSIRVLFVGNGV